MNCSSDGKSSGCEAAPGRRREPRDRWSNTAEVRRKLRRLIPSGIHGGNAFSGGRACGMSVFSFGCEFGLARGRSGCGGGAGLPAREFRRMRVVAGNAVLARDGPHAPVPVTARAAVGAGLPVPHRSGRGNCRTIACFPRTSARGRHGSGNSCRLFSSWQLVQRLLRLLRPCPMTMSGCSFGTIRL